MDATRASDLEREQTAERLREAHLDGRLEPAELDERLDAAFAARTRGELARLTADLPWAGSGAFAVALPPGRRRTAKRVAAAGVAGAGVVLVGTALLVPPEIWFALAIVTVVLAFVLIVTLAGLAPFIAVGGGAVWAWRALSRRGQEHLPPPEAPTGLPARPERPGRPGRPGR